jgi:hypothetical protein
LPDTGDGPRAGTEALTPSRSVCPSDDAWRGLGSRWILTRALARDDTATSATSELTALHDPAAKVRQNAAEHIDALGVAAESVIGPANLARMEQTVESITPGLTDCPAWPALRSRLMTIGLNDTNPYAALQRAVQAQPLDSAMDAAAVLAWRLQCDESRAPGPLPGPPPVHTQVAQHPDWGHYFDRRVEVLRAMRPYAPPRLRHGPQSLCPHRSSNAM